MVSTSPSQPSGSAPNEGGRLPECTNCPLGRPARYFLALSPAFDVLHRDVDDDFAALHVALETSGALPAARVDWRQPVVREWTMAHGWR